MTAFTIFKPSLLLACLLPIGVAREHAKIAAPVPIQEPIFDSP